MTEVYDTIMRWFRHFRWAFNKKKEEIRQYVRRIRKYKNDARIYMIQYRNSLRAFKILFRAGMRITQTDPDGRTNTNRIRFHWDGKIMDDMADVDVIDGVFYEVAHGHSKRLT